MKRLLRNLAAAVALTCSSAVVLAQSYPTRVITLVVPFAAGGPSDAVARHIAQSMSGTLKQQVVIENVAGAGGTTGAARVAKAQPDGYTLLIHHVALAASPSLYKALSFDPLKDFTPLGLINFGPMVLVAKKDYPSNDAKEILAKLKADGSKTTIAHAGVGSNSHLCGLLLQQALGTKLTEVAYRGTGPAMTDLMGGQVDVLCDQTTNAVPQITGSTLKAYAVTSQRRLDVLPNLPTMIEAELPDFEFIIWHGLYAPKGTPNNIVDELNKALKVAIADSTVKARFAEVGTDVFPSEELTPEAHKTRLEKEVAKWRYAISKAGISPGN